MENDPARVAALFTRPDGAFRFTRWGRPLAPMVYGTDDKGIEVFETALKEVAALAGLEIVEMDPDLAANFLVFFVKSWDELAEVPHLSALIPGIADLAKRLRYERATQYRVFGFDANGRCRVLMPNTANTPATIEDLRTLLSL